MTPETDTELGGPGLPPFVQDPVGVLRRRWRWMLAALVLGLLGTGAVVWALIRPTYTAEATILVASQRISESVVRPTVQEDSFEKLNAMVGEILATDQLAGLIHKHDLYPELRERETIAAAADVMREHIGITPEQGIGNSYYEKARLFRITFNASDPEVAAAVANDIAALFTFVSNRIRTQQAGLAHEFLRRGLEEADIELREQNRKMAAFQERYRGELPADLEPNLRRIERLQQQRQSIALQIAEAETRMAMLASNEEKLTPEARVAELRAKLTREASVHTAEHPNVLSLRRQLAAAEAALAANPPGSRDGGTSKAALGGAALRTVEALRRQDIEAAAMIEDLERRVERIPAREEELSAMQEKANVLRETYVGFLRKVQEAELAEDLEAQQQGERVSVLDRAQPPSRPDRPRSFFLLAGIVGSLGLAVAAGVLLELVDPVLLTPEQIEAIGGLPVLGSVARLS